MQLEYAALDAAVLVHIFGHVRGHSQPADGEGQGKLEWKSCIVSEDTESFSDRGVYLSIVANEIGIYALYIFY